MTTTSNRNLLVTVFGDCFITITSNNIKTGEIKNKTFPCEKVAEIIEHLPLFVNLKNVKAMLFQVKQIEEVPYSEVYESRHRCKELCERNGIAYAFEEEYYFHVFAAISEIKPVVDNGEKVLVVLHWPEYVQLFLMGKKNDAYFFIEERKATNKKRKYLAESMKDLEFDKMIIKHQDSFTPMTDVDLCLQIYNPMVAAPHPFEPQKIEARKNKLLLEKLKHVTGEKINPWIIAPKSVYSYQIHIGKSCLMETNKFDVLPFEKCLIVEVNPDEKACKNKNKLSLSVKCDFPEIFNEIVQEIRLSTVKTKKAKITLKVDENLFHQFKAEPIKDETGEEQSSVNEMSLSKYPATPEKARMIFDKQSFAVSVFAESKEYYLLDSDSLQKTPIYIGFTEKKPAVGKHALEMHAAKPKFVVYDIIKLCSVSSLDIIDPKWGFTVSKEEGQSIMVTMETQEGEKSSSVGFLLAIVLRNGKQRIFKETGVKMDKLEIGFNGFAANGMLKENFKEAAELLKIDIEFV